MSALDSDRSTIPPASERLLIPASSYLAQLKHMEPFTARTGTPGIRLTFEVILGPYKGRLCTYRIWRTKRAQAYARRDLAKLGVFHELGNDSQVAAAAQAVLGQRFVVIVAIQKTLGGEEFNDVTGFVNDNSYGAGDMQ